MWRLCCDMNAMMWRLYVDVMTLRWWDNSVVMWHLCGDVVTLWLCDNFTDATILSWYDDCVLMCVEYYCIDTVHVPLLFLSSWGSYTIYKAYKLHKGAKRGLHAITSMEPPHPLGQFYQVASEFSLAAWVSWTSENLGCVSELIQVSWVVKKVPCLCCEIILCNCISCKFQWFISRIFFLYPVEAGQLGALPLNAQQGTSFNKTYDGRLFVRLTKTKRK
jgi:hypothetical protein